MKQETQERRRMTYQERQAVGNLIAGIIIFAAYFYWVWRAIDGGLLGNENAATTIGRGILVLILGGVLLNIGIQILTSIAVSIITREPKPSFVVDERDRMLELRAVRVSYTIIGMGFIASMVALALGLVPLVVLQFIVLSFAVGTIFESILMLIFYRWSVV